MRRKMAPRPPFCWICGPLIDGAGGSGANGANELEMAQMIGLERRIRRYDGSTTDYFPSYLLQQIEHQHPSMVQYDGTMIFNKIIYK